MAVRPDLTEDFLSGTNGAHVTTSNTTFDTSSGTLIASQPTFTNVSHGSALAMKFTAASAGTATMRVEADAAVPLLWEDFFLRFDTLPAGTLAFVQFYNGDTDIIGALRVVPVTSTTFQLQLRDVNTSRWTSTTINTGEWHRVAVLMDPGTNVRCKIYTGSNLDTDTVTQDSGLQSAANSAALAAGTTNVRYGILSSAATVFSIARIRANDATQPTMGGGGGGGTTIAALTEGFEDGTAGNVLTDPTSFISSHTGGFSGTFFADPYANTNCFRSNPTAGLDNYRIDLPDPVAEGWIKFAFKLVTNPGGNMTVLQVWSGANAIGNLQVVPGAGVYQLRWRNGSSTQVAISSNLALNAYHEVALWVDPAASQAQLKVYSGANRGTSTATYNSTLLTSAPAGGATSFNQVNLGTLSTETTDMRFDTFRSDTTTEPAGITPPGDPVSVTLSCPTAASHEPYDVCTLTATVTGGTAPFTPTFNQTAGTTQTLSGSGLVRTFTPSGLQAGETLTFTVDISDALANTDTSPALNVVVEEHNKFIESPANTLKPFTIFIKRGGVLI